MARIQKSLVVLCVSIMIFSSFLGMVGGLEYADDGANPVIEIDAEPVYKAAFDPWQNYTGSTIYHTWEEMLAELNQTLIDHPDIVKMISIGKTWENRDIWAVKISDNPEIEEPDEPEVYFNSNHHAREWLTIEIALYTLAFLTDNYGTNATVTDIVNTRQIWIIPSVNPDGRIADSTGDEPGVHAVPGNWGWRKNLRDNNGDEIFDMAVDGVDLNRNYGYMWGSSGASSDPTQYTYGGPSGFSEPETQAVRDFARQHNFVFAISYHTYSQLILYPYGWTYELAPDNDVLVSVANEMADRITNKAGSSYPYVPEKSSGLYPTAGSDDDWLYGELGILAYCVEAYPNLQDYYDGDPALNSPYDPFHPREDKVLPACEDNLPAALFLCQIADNPYQVMDHVEISTVEEIVIERGTLDTATVDILNNGRRNDDFTVTTSTIPGWSISALPANHYISRNQTVQSTLSITVPGAASPGEYTVWVNVSSDSNSTCTDSCQLTVIVPYSDDVGVDSIAPFEELGVYPLGEYRFNASVKNYGEFQVPSFDTTCTITRFGGGSSYNLFYDDMESGMGNWITEDWDNGVDYWHLVNTWSHSPSNSVWCGPLGGGNYGDWTTQFLISADPVDLRSASSATLSYWTSYDIENSWDFTIVEGSKDGGQTWEFIARYTGTDITWVERTHDISNFTGYADFKLRFRFTSDGATTATGFWLDDVSIDAFIPGETIVFGPDPLPTSGALDPQNAEALGWQYDFTTSGTYRISMETGYPTDGNTANDLLDVIIDIDPDARLPDFAGADRVENPGTGDELDIYWDAANDPNLPITYSLYRFDHMPDEAEVNASTPIWTGTALSYNDAGLTSGQTYYYVVRAADDLGQEEWNMVVVNGTPVVLLFFQVQSPMAGYRNLNSDAFEAGLQLADSPPLETAGQYRIGGTDDHWLSDIYPTPTGMDGTWNFNVWGQANNAMASGNLYARVYRYSDSFLLFQTGSDNEDIASFAGMNHEFTWSYDVSGVTLPAGDRFYVELWLDVASGSGAAQYGETLNPDFTTDASNWAYYGWLDTGGGSASGAWTGAGGNPGGNVYVQLDPATSGGATEQTYAGYWEQSFTAGFVPAGATLDFDWSCTAFGSGDANLNAIAFIDTASGAPVNEVWNSGSVTGTTGWASASLDVSTHVNSATTYYLKMAVRDTDLARFETTRQISFDNVILNYSVSAPVFTFTYDNLATPSSLQAPLSPGAEPATYDIDLTGVSAGSWVFVSFPIDASGNPETVLDDAAHGDGNTTWDMIRWYDGNDTSDHWKTHSAMVPGASDLPFVNNNMGFWLHITANTGDQLLTLGNGGNPASTAIVLQAGWNLVGYPSATPRQADATLPGQVIAIDVFNAGNPPYYLESLPLASVTMSQGNAYWVYSTAYVVWNVDW